MNNTIKRYTRPTKYMFPVALALALSAGLSSCTKNFEDLNTDNISVTPEDLLPNAENLKLYFTNAQRAILNFSDGSANSYQLQQNLMADVYGGYLMSANPFNSGQNNMNYALVNAWNTEPFKVLYLDVLGPINRLEQTNLRETYPALWGSVLAVKVLATSRVTDIYGPIPYSIVGKNTDTNIPYDAQEAVYEQLFAELDEAQTLLEAYVNGTNQEELPPNLDEIDLIYSGNDNTVRFTKWLKLVQSLRLRLAMRVVKVNPSLAQEQGAKALSSNYLLESNADNAKVRIDEEAGFFNPLEFISNNWSDININASLESYLSGYQDPRIGKYIDRATDTGIDGYKGIRVGAVGLVKETYSRYSTINFKDGAVPSFNRTTAPLLMTAAEVYFLRAEAALRGWANPGGTAKSLYESGVEASFEQWGTTGATAYLQNNSNTPAAYVDPHNSRNNAAQPSTITVQWDEASNQEQKLERIITQKWLALFPEGQEAWSEYRRTGYPKLFPVAQNNSGGLINTDTQIRRIPFSQNEYNTNNAEVQKAISLLGGSDNGGTRLWWDVDQGNF
ncbi:SusD/RagB family nutrient-binding outer membrane lipoprotein [Sphingobacterium bambusae]|uniref:SusD/RagB family nutrient-binding outer membrane lipoprotein n=1 Tax=Sphingobacterium bambusae TaxID=662858 RepID=A0ABW6BJ95_9SPHI|nr:SusD/RagB family nutrient-binding outer membrane lipoprotein [Sphingobacterium bambusae]WPL49873.1 SusD/RagB family nutrient-binding outer membrane lipoprotein [Sphingobacterium bambusae]